MVNTDKGHIIIYIAKYILLLCALVCSVVHVDARVFEAGEKVYINAVQNDAVGDWSKAGTEDTKLFLYFYQSNDNSNTENEWVELTRVESSNEFEGTLVPYHSSYDRVIVIRKSSSGTANNWNDRMHQSCNIIIPDNNYNFLS